MSLTTDLAAYESDSFVSLTEADTYFENHWDIDKSNEWANLANLTKEIVLKQATSLINGLCFWDSPVPVNYSNGINLRLVTVTPYEINQSLKFPRNIDLDENGDPFIPESVIQATCEQDIFLVMSVNEAAIQSRMQGIIYDRVAAGSVEVEQRFEGKMSPSDIASSTFSPICRMLLEKYIRKSNKLTRA